MESRLHIVSSDIFDEFVNLSVDWKGMKTLGIILSARMADGIFNADDISVRYSISFAELTAEEFTHAAREYWAIENTLHWKMDVAMREDDCRIRRDSAAEMLSGFRQMAVNMLNNTKTYKAGLKRKQKEAVMSTQYLSEVLAGTGFYDFSLARIFHEPVVNLLKPLLTVGFAQIIFGHTSPANLRIKPYAFKACREDARIL